MASQPSNSDVIAAIATGPGRGGIGVVRVSGGKLAAIIDGIVGKPLKPRYAHFATFRNGQGEPLDEGIALHFPAPHSFTGEDVLELQGHGGPQVLQLVLERCVELGARVAEPGEFSRRAFLNDKIDLAQAESIADLIDAQSKEAARSAVRSLTGEFSRHVHEMVDALINLRMLVEATLDFPEEEIDFLEKADAFGRLAGIQNRLNQVLAQASQGALLREGLNVVLIGQPNVGKSSLLNRLAGYEAAIVTEIAGTTRDALREAIQIDGIPLHITDTAGLRETNDPVEAMGIARTWKAVEQADIALLLVDASHGLSTHEQAIIDRLPAIPRLTLHNKIDLTGEIVRISDDGREIWLSARTGDGMEQLRQRLCELAGWQAAGEGIFMARRRHLEALSEAAGHLVQAKVTLPELDIFAEELRLSQNALSSITGEFSADDLLGEIFSRFCIGK
jgi:tRNA modification GTPase